MLKKLILALAIGFSFFVYASFPEYPHGNNSKVAANSIAEKINL